MNKVLILSFLAPLIIFCQENNVKSDNPCADPLLALARKNGVKSLPIKDLPRYLKVSKACREMGGDAMIDQIYINEYNRDYKRSKYMSSWTSTYGMCITVMIFYFFLGLVTVKK